MVRDPVCAMELEPRSAAAMATHNGRAYYFCSARCRDTFLEQPDVFAGNSPASPLTVGVMGSAGHDSPPDALAKARALGAAVAEQGFTLITGACPGLPYECARGATAAGGLSVGISPGLSLDEHIHKYLSPADAYDVLIYTGSGLMGREVTNIRSSDMVVILGGRSGTLGEFAIAYDEGKLIGVLEGTGGITAEIPRLVGFIPEADRGANGLRGRPAKLVSALVSAYTQHHYRRPSCFCDERIGVSG